MQEAILRSLQLKRTQIRARWEAFLRVEKVSTPLANPDTLVYLFDHTLDEVFAALHDSSVLGTPVLPVEAGDENPLIAYFGACEQALLEALILAQAKIRGLEPRERDADFVQLRQIMRQIARREIGTIEEVFKSRKWVASQATNESGRRRVMLG